MPFHDLNLTYTTNHAELSHVLSFHAELGYSVIALSLSLTGKLPSAPETLPVSSLTIPKSLSILTRLTLTIADTSQNHRIASLQPHYDLIALRPTSEKALQLCCSSLECDLISLDFSQRLPFILRFKTVASALQRGIRFEICYAPGITGGNDARRNLISGATALVRATRGKGIVVSSEARNALGLRAPHDLINLCQVWGLGQERGKEAVCEEAGKVVRLARLRRTSFRGVVDILGVETQIVDGDSNKVERSTGDAAALVKNTATAENPYSEDNVELATSGGVKRKASSTLMQTAASTNVDDKPISRREQKRRAKKARLAAGQAEDETESVQTSSGFPIQHETLLKSK